MFKVGGWLLGWCIVPLLPEKKPRLEAVIVEPAVEDGFNLPLLLSIDNDSRWWRCNLSWIGVVGGLLQKREVENGMDLDCHWEALVNSTGSTTLNYLIWAQPAMVNLNRGSASLDISGVEPKPVTWLKYWCWGMPVVTSLSLYGRSAAHLYAKVVMDLLDGGC